MATLAEIRAKLQAQETRTTGGSGGDNAIYPHWNISEGTTATLRFLRFKSGNTFFRVQRAMIRLSFRALKDKLIVNLLLYKFLYGNVGTVGSCPNSSEVRPGLKIPSPEDMGLQVLEKEILCIPRVCSRESH